MNMKFLKVHPQLAISLDKIVKFDIKGREGDVMLVATLVTGGVLTIARFKDFKSAELALIDLVDLLEGES